VKSGLDSLSEFGFKHILVVPGNHDYGTGILADKNFVKLFKLTFFGMEIRYPKVDIVADSEGDTAFLGLDSMAEELHWYDRIAAEGELGKRQLDDLRQIIHRNEVKNCRFRVIYLHHHPFDSYPLHQLKDSDHLKDLVVEAIKDGISIDALLYGHNHQGKIHNGHWGVPRCYDAGTATGKDRSSRSDLPDGAKSRTATRCIKLNRPVTEDYVIDLL
jgi:3',5'-cyclic AMP phosphodiesterase CpdA